MHNMKTNTPRVDALSHLDDYNTVHQNASKSLKSCIWNISKARRLKGGHGVGYAYTATDVREHLRTQALVQCHQELEPCLVEEELSSEDKHAGPIHECFKLHFGSMTLQNSKESNTPELSTERKDTGLRQRRGKDPKKETAGNQWSEENLVDKEEKKIDSINPIELFDALPPKELKLAQSQAKEALQMYIKAANSAVEILRITTDEPGRSTINKEE